ncbi:MAG: glycosyltransferase, partial [Alphaproteobacteria bacterium]|nr:glycosyltransferase [Alphaproteobacteria bacterium]
DIAIEVARLCPDIPFSFVEAWPLADDDRAELARRLAELPNVTLLLPQKDMRSVYGACKILLAPSVWNEAYGRVATEAQVSGIPVVASNRGGLPEAVGPGGAILDPESPVEIWAEAVRKLWRDEDAYAALSCAARAHAERIEGSLSYKIDRWERLLADACRGRYAISS